MISTLVTWISANMLYAFVGLVGLVVGIFYGFDGWRGNTEELEFKDSPRFKNLVYVLGGGFGAFFGDLKALDSKAEKLPVMFAYFLPCVLAGVAVVIGWGIVIGIQRLYAAWKGRMHSYGVVDAVGDYFFFGYRYYRARAAAAAAAQNEAANFHTAYSAQLSLAVAAAGAVTPATRVQTARAILTSVAAVIRSYHRDDQNTKGIRANLMLQKTCDNQLRQRLVFVGANRAQVTRCLELISYDSIEDEPGIVIPLPDAIAGAGARALPGAPMAFLHPDRYAIIDDTLQIEFATAIPQDVRAEIKAYLEQKTFRSFGSIQVPGSAGILGVINLEARVTQVFGRTDDEKRKVISYLLPFCAALAIVFPNP